MDDLWNVRKYKEGDEKAILALREEVFGDVEPEKRSPSFWEWEFKKNNAGKAHIYLAYLEDNGLVIGHHALLPGIFYVKGREVTGSLGCDSMTKPGHRYPSMFFSLVEESLEGAGKEGVSFNFGFVYRTGLPAISKACGLKTIFKTPILVRPINFSNLCKHYIKNGFLSSLASPLAKAAYILAFKTRLRRVDKDIKVREIKEFDDSFDDLWKSVKNDFDIIQKRDKKYLDWRFAANPRNYIFLKAEKDGRTEGYAIVRKEELFGLNCLIICDMLARGSSPVPIYSLNGKIEKLAKAMSADLIGVMVTENNSYFDAFKKSGYIKSPMSFDFTFKCMDGSLKPEELSPKNFYLTWADSDTM